ncbi:hypothetical protein [Erythrobacter colymbi]|uniref:hypothetical protein n=1 Tax=Erythrobacter colymbi TaxID=1161202 RepID=UPI0012DE88E9|nr:hypothetical protein [Erythrobacter colymbi]
MNAPEWFDVAPGHAGFGRLTATHGAFRSILRTMLPYSMRAEFFGASEVQQ